MDTREDLHDEKYRVEGARGEQAKRRKRRSQALDELDKIELNPARYETHTRFSLFLISIMVLPSTDFLLHAD